MRKKTQARGIRRVAATAVLALTAAVAGIALLTGPVAGAVSNYEGGGGSFGGGGASGSW